MSVGRNIRRAREEKGLSQGDLAGLIGVSVDAIRALEQGKNKAPRNFGPFVEALGWTEQELRFGRDTTLPESHVDPTDGDNPAPVPEETILRIAKRVGLDERRTQSFLRHRWSGGMPSEATLESYALDMLREQRRAELSGEAEDAPPPNAFMDRGKKHR